MDVVAAIQFQINGLKTFENSIAKLIQEIILDNESVIVELNSEEQLYEQGINTYGVKISDYQPYTEVTIEEKKMKGQPTNRVTLRDEGDFENSFSIRITSTYFQIIAGDWKVEELTKKYGDEILGLTDENILELSWQYIYPELSRILKNYLGL